MYQKFLIMFAMIFIILGTVNAQTDTPDELLRYQFEEGSGSVILDSSGFGNNAVVNAGTWTTGVYGIYQFQFDGVDDWIQTVTSSSIPNNMTISFFMRADTSGQDNVWSIYDTNDNINFLAKPNTAGNNIEITYLNTTGSLVTVTLMNTAFVQSSSFHVVLSFDFDAQNVDFYWNGVKTSHALPSPVSRTSSANILRVGTDSSGNNDFSGYIDEFRIYNFIVNQSQVDDLRLNNHITIPVLPDIGDGSGINATVQANIINSTSPLTGNYSGYVTFEVLLNLQATCELYINNKLDHVEYATVSFTHEKLLENGENDYFVYCEYIQDSTKYYQFSEIQTLNISTPITFASFQIQGTDFNIADESLYLMTPCPEKGYSVTGMEEMQPYRSEYNLGGIRIMALNNGIVSFNISADTHEFCLFNGRVNYDTEDYKTNNYKIIESNGMLKIGEIYVPNNVTNNYILKVDQFEIYDKINPKAWGVSWPLIITGFLSLFLGILLLIASVKANSPHGVVIGGILILAGLGFQLPTIGVLLGL